MNVIDENEVLNAAQAPAEPQVEAQAVVEDEGPKSLIGQKLVFAGGGKERYEHEVAQESIEKNHLTRIGENINEKAEYRDGWIDVDRSLLGDRNAFYPADWVFRIRPANVEAIRNWSTIDDENPNSVDDVFNEILKSCFAIKTSKGVIPWGNIHSWDRFYFILLIRAYTFVNGEAKISFDEECPGCENAVNFTLDAGSLMFETPDSETMQYYDAETMTWNVDPTDFDVNGDMITLYLPTLERDANIKAWLIERVRNDKKVDKTFIKFLPWMSQRISKDLTVATKQIRELEIKFKQMDTDTFSLVNEIINNVAVTPINKLITTCPICGEEVTAEIRFPNGIRDLFNISSGRKKFGKK